MWIALSLAAFGGDLTADQIIDEARSRNTAERVVQELRMVVVSRSGKERSRDLQILARRTDDETRSMIVFTAPSDVAGTKMLMVEPKDGADQQLLYLPAFDRIQPISGAARKGAFMGSDFSYEDLDLGGRPGDTHTLVETTADAWVIDTTPGDGSQYGRIRTTMGQADYVARTVEYFDGNGEATKTLEVKETKEVDGHIVPARSVMTTLAKNTSTRLEMVSVDFDVPEEDLPATALTRDALEAK